MYFKAPPKGGGQLAIGSCSAWRDLSKRAPHGVLKRSARQRQRNTKWILRTGEICAQFLPQLRKNRAVAQLDLTLRGAPQRGPLGDHLGLPNGEHTIEEADELIKTFNGLLLIARLEAGVLEDNAERFDLGRVVAAIRKRVSASLPSMPARNTPSCHGSGGARARYSFFTAEDTKAS